MSLNFRGSVSHADKREIAKPVFPVMFPEGLCAAAEEAPSRYRELYELGSWDGACLFFGGRESHRRTL